MATFAAGCFWGVEYKFDQVAGVLGTVVGYTGGRTDKPTYPQVCTDKTGHAEAVRGDVRPARHQLRGARPEFFSFHDPTQLNRQGPDVGTQYRSADLRHGDAQRATAEKVKAEVGDGRAVHEAGS